MLRRRRRRSAMSKLSTRGPDALLGWDLDEVLSCGSEAMVDHRNDPADDRRSRTTEFIVTKEEFQAGVPDDVVPFHSSDGGGYRSYREDNCYWCGRMRWLECPPYCSPVCRTAHELVHLGSHVRCSACEGKPSSWIDRAPAFAGYAWRREVCDWCDGRGVYRKLRLVRRVNKRDIIEHRRPRSC